MSFISNPYHGGAPFRNGFLAPAGSSGGIPEAPEDGILYGRKDATWQRATPEAPNDGILYGRFNYSWIKAVEEAPEDNQKYARINGSWEAILPVSSGSPAQAGFTASGGVTPVGGGYSIPMVFGGDETIQTNDVCPPPAGIGSWTSTKNMGYFSGSSGDLQVVGINALIRNYITNASTGFVTFRIVHYPADGSSLSNFNAGSAGQVLIDEIQITLPNTSGGNRFYFGESLRLTTPFIIPANRVIFCYVSSANGIQSANGYTVTLGTEIPV